ncbi:MAG: L,D-transpeptidase [Simkaniaceae bacterium]|nr:L,D-transpeptidase [Simkaniaceae bacterium]
MSVTKYIFNGALALFGCVTAVGMFKKHMLAKKSSSTHPARVALPPPATSSPFTPLPDRDTEERKESGGGALDDPTVALSEDPVERDRVVDLVWRLFTTGKEKFPVVETLSYKTRVPWLTGRPAWISDYASRYRTSRHFIARSLHEKRGDKRNYDMQNPEPGDRFNVFASDVDLQFHLVVDLSRCKMWFYYHDLGVDERVLLRIYSIGLGRFDPHSPSGLLTPKGSFLLGDRVAIYKPGIYGRVPGGEGEMVTVFGTRWLPFIERGEGKKAGVRGYGFHGIPWTYDEGHKTFREDTETIGKYESDGCIRLRREDIEELYAIVISRPTFVEVVSDYRDADLPGKEVER